jgi:hypothetical protein
VDSPLGFGGILGEICFLLFETTLPAFPGGPFTFIESCKLLSDPSGGILHCPLSPQFPSGIEIVVDRGFGAVKPRCKLLNGPAMKIKPRYFRETS